MFSFFSSNNKAEVTTKINTTVSMPMTGKEAKMYAAEIVDEAIQNVHDAIERLNEVAGNHRTIAQERLKMIETGKEVVAAIDSEAERAEKFAKTLSETVASMIGVEVVNAAATTPAPAPSLPTSVIPLQSNAVPVAPAPLNAANADQAAKVA